MKLSIDRLIKLIPEWNGKLIKVNPKNSGITNINFEVTVGKEIIFSFYAIFKFRITKYRL